MTEEPKASVPGPGAPTLWGGDAETRCLLDRLAETARTRPDGVAVRDGEHELTYCTIWCWFRCTGRRTGCCAGRP
ncbi:hypothetical protein, partial [Streptomyces sp. NPDC088135]|uniref:hypothetical protein n=1 Tax=Streptomyces sp. NPDC088135 TaxID=3160993 RepID=UPI003444D04D